MHDQREAANASERSPVEGEPRVAPLPVDTLTDDLRMLLTRMAEVNRTLDSREKHMAADILSPDATEEQVANGLANMPEIMCTMVRHANLFAVMTDLGIQLLAGGVIPLRERELAVLRVGWICQAPYEFGEHVLVAKKIGITSEEIERVKQGPQAPGWSAHERAILQAVDDLRTHAMISDAAWAVLAETYNDKQLIELPILIGQYQTVAYYQNSLRLRLHDGNLGLAAR